MNVDPVYAIIERHKALSAAYTAAADVSGKLGAGPEFEAADAITAERCDALFDYAETLDLLRAHNDGGHRRVDALCRQSSGVADAR